MSNPQLVIAQFKTGFVGSFPALNLHKIQSKNTHLEQRLTRNTKKELYRDNQENPDRSVLTIEVNQVVYVSNTRMESDLEFYAKWKVSIWITSPGARAYGKDVAHSCGRNAFNDVISDNF